MPLSWAACCGNESVYNLLIDLGADPNATDFFGNMILHMVVVCDKLVSKSSYNYGKGGLMLILDAGNVWVCFETPACPRHNDNDKQCRPYPADTGLRFRKSDHLQGNDGTDCN